MCIAQPFKSFEFSGVSIFLAYMQVHWAATDLRESKAADCSVAEKICMADKASSIVPMYQLALRDLAVTCCKRRSARLTGRSLERGESSLVIFWTLPLVVEALASFGPLSAGARAAPLRVQPDSSLSTADPSERGHLNFQTLDSKEASKPS